MSRIAIIADIHANLFALDAVVDDIGSQGVDEVIVAGDLVGRGPQGSAVVHRVEQLGWKCVRGNHEDYLLSFWFDDIPDDWKHLPQWAGSRWMTRELDQRCIDFIEQLPFSLHSDVDPAIQVFHGSPNSHTEGLGHWTDDERLDEFLEVIDGSVLICAHTHRPLEYHGDNGLVVNVGSVGLPFNGDWRAQYALLEDDTDGYDVTFRRIDYPRQKFLDYYDSSGFLEQGGITARLLHHEVRHARPFLVPFLKWSEMTGRAPVDKHLDDFLDVYDPTESMRTFFSQVRDDANRPV